MRKSEDDMDIASGQEFLAARLDPTVTSVSLALGTVPITTAVIRDDAMPAAGTLIQMSTEYGGAAALDSRQDLEMLPAEPGAAALDEFLSRGADEIGHLQGWSMHLGVSGRLVFLPSRQQQQAI